MLKCFKDEGIEITDEQQAEIDEKSGACSVVYLAVGDKLTGALCISDPPRPEAEEAVKQLKEAGITNIIMLTGDSAKETADITVRGADLTQLAAIRQLSEKLMHRINSNYRFILLFNSVLLLSGAFGLLQPSASALLHNASTMAICAKSMTPLEDKKRKKKNK